MEPAAMLVRAFQIKISRKMRLKRMRSAQHGLVRGAGIKPDIQRVLVFFIQRGIGANTQAQVANTSMSGYEAEVQQLMQQRAMEMQQRNQSLGLMVGGMTPVSTARAVLISEASPADCSE